MDEENYREKRKKRTLKKQEILSKRIDFKNTFLFGKKIENTNLKIFFYKNSSQITRIAIIVSKKFGKAVIRNKIKRIIKEIYRNNKSKFQGFYDIIFIPIGNWGGFRYHDIEKIVYSLIDLIKD
ncbi:MAG: ribonuclease P protein component [bacterium]